MKRRPYAQLAARLTGGLVAVAVMLVPASELSPQPETGEGQAVACSASALVVASSNNLRSNHSGVPMSPQRLAAWQKARGLR